MIRESGAAHAGQGDTCLGPGAHWGLRCYRSEVLLRLRPSMFCWRSRALSKEIQASSPARLRLSSAQRSLVCVPLIEGERTDADASCWRRDDRDLDLVEVECAMSSSRSTLSHHCFMAPGEAVELGGCRSNSLAAYNAPGATPWLLTAAVPGTGRLGTCGV